MHQCGRSDEGGPLDDKPVTNGWPGRTKRSPIRDRGESTGIAWRLEAEPERCQLSMQVRLFVHHPDVDVDVTGIRYRIL